MPLAEVDREYLDKVYYLGPDKGGDRAYRLLAEALKETGKAALGQYAARGQQHLVLLRPLNGVLVMEQLHYADEVRSTTEVPVPDGEVQATGARRSRSSSSSRPRPTRSSRRSTRTRCASACMEAIQRKVDGQDITADVDAGRRRQDHRPHGSAEGEPREDEPPKSEEDEAEGAKAS